MVTNKRNVPEAFKNHGIDLDYDDVFSLICKNAKIQINDDRFLYFIDEDYIMDTTKGYRYENITPAYEKILDKGLLELEYTIVDDKFSKSFNNVCDSLAIFCDRIKDELTEANKEDCRIRWFIDMKDKPAQHFEEGVQRLLFINQVFWQTDHRLVGLGAWDRFLGKLYEKDIADGIITKEKALEVIKDIMRILHKNYTFKSNVLMGDTGQIFVLGGSTANGDYACNELTYLFIEASKEVHQPDPKCLLRVNKNTPVELLKLSLETIATGIGAPLFANDDVIIPCLKDFGVKEEDSYCYATSACWEPLIGGKSASNNNRTVLNYCKALDNLLKRENLKGINSYEELLNIYEKYLRLNMRAVKRVIQAHRFQYNPLLSVFMHGCFESKKDVSWGGAEYLNTGITSVGMGNLVNSLKNIRKYVFEEKKYTLSEIKEILINDYAQSEELLNALKNESSDYGKDNADVITLVNRFTSVVSEELKDFTTYLGERMKVGLSGSAYLDAGKVFGATFDGRKSGQPFVVHISNEDNNGFTEIVNFASELNYQQGLFNGNVLDFMVSPDFILNNIDKFTDFLKASILSGFFEMQMNVVSSKQMIEARSNPDKFPNLIVRVWGFSAYFNDLPDEYKDVLIERAKKNEQRAA